MKKRLLLITFLFGLISFAQNSNYDIYHNNAVSLLIKGDYERALNDINKAININSKKADSYYVRGNIYQKLGDLNKALNDFRKAIELNSKHSDAMMKCAIIYGQSGQNSTACYYLKKACELGNSDACDGNRRFCASVGK